MTMNHQTKSVTDNNIQNIFISLE